MVSGKSPELFQKFLFNYFIIKILDINFPLNNVLLLDFDGPQLRNLGHFEAISFLS
ncbi:hypothetical protein A33Q_3318 [Indibacter alkaliphilus LW1]|uniref:Uncharacterized protein n=1 Tax=Indibacter alkaliphilus (strain CCUG 57479 / KCTC 22604 / LW1) TaxID=1189612 RepID=S2DZA2_INDAL|nr:hypothetical protein A33Q_3318 [Indibacter alkaliphilus LW1]